MRRAKAEFVFDVTGDDGAVAAAPIVLQAHDASAPALGQLSRFRQRHLAGSASFASKIRVIVFVSPLRAASRPAFGVPSGFM